MGEIEGWVANIEEWTPDITEALTQSLQTQESLQMKLTDLEAHTRWNNLCVYGIPEGSEGNNIQQFIDDFN